MKRGASATVLLVLSVCTAVARDIPLAEVLAKPRDFDGKRVALTGYYVAATETSCLFTTRDAAKRFDIARSIWVEFRTPPILDSIAGHQSRLVGTFHYSPRVKAGILREYGHNNGWSVALLDVTEFHRLR